LRISFCGLQFNGEGVSYRPQKNLVSFDSSCLNRDFMGAKACSTFDMLPLETSLEEEDEIEDV
jgi:hypothetical protein